MPDFPTFHPDPQQSLTWYQRIGTVLVLTGAVLAVTAVEVSHLLRSKRGGGR